ncbi:MAG: hypothetical protein PHU27_06045 [Salinivirgaceae bacterium]|nr:hypothetical protein [Salinivirgaceae bacterium]MDD4746573.1 hypothetical protein [Salinivirgaceae bacterium]MDY0281564.1 hypothetical protein [Salinivirgaceae bacterium]
MKNIILIFTALLLSGTVMSQNCDCNILKTKDVPQKVIIQFEKSVIFSETGFFRGAYIGGLAEYLNDAEIQIFLAEKFKITNSRAIYKGYKPKGPRGCKVDLNWICLLEDYSTAG